MDHGSSLHKPHHFALVVIARRNDEAILQRSLLANALRLLRRLKKPSRNDDFSYTIIPSHFPFHTASVHQQEHRPIGLVHYPHNQCLLHPFQ